MEQEKTNRHKQSIIKHQSVNGRSYDEKWIRIKTMARYRVGICVEGWAGKASWTSRIRCRNIAEAGEEVMGYLGEMHDREWAARDHTPVFEGKRGQCGHSVMSGTRRKQGQRDSQSWDVTGLEGYSRTPGAIGWKEASQGERARNMLSKGHSCVWIKRRNANQLDRHGSGLKKCPR